MIPVQSEYFHLAFEQISSDFPSSKSCDRKYELSIRPSKNKESKLLKDYINAVLRTALTNVASKDNILT